MAKKLLVLTLVLMIAAFVSQETTRVASGPAAAPQSTSSRLVQLALGGVVIALSPVGVMAGCGGGGGGPRPTSATAVALAESVLRMGATDVPAGLGSSSAGIVSRLTITDRRPVSNLAVDIRVSGPDRGGHTRLALRHPDGTEVSLFDGDSALMPATFDTANRPELREMFSRSPEGVWSLVASSSAGNSTVDSWSLRLSVRE